MTQNQTAGPGGERWNVNLPAVTVVVFALLIGVIVWVVAGGGDGQDAGDPVPSTPGTSEPATDSGTLPDESLTTTPAPMPETTAAPTTAPDTTPAETTAAPTTAPVTAAPGAGDGAVPGDLAIAGRPMQRPGCDDSFITILASAVGDQVTGAGIAALLDAYPGSEYLRTDQTCSSLRPDVDGAPIYVVYLGPFAFASDACAARTQGPEGAYAKQLSNSVPPDTVVSCA